MVNALPQFSRPVLLALIAALAAPGCSDSEAPASDRSATLSSAKRLSEWAPVREPWEFVLPANSEQRQPFFAGLTPFDLVRGAPETARPVLPVALGRIVREQAEAIARALGKGDVEFEAWPVQDEEGRLNWAFARSRPPSAGSSWEWIDAARIKGRLEDLETEPLLPELLDPAVRAQSREIFQDFLQSDDLYFKPAFGDCVWTDPAGGVIHAGWRDPGQRERFRSEELPRLSGAACRRIAQPARWNGHAVTFDVRVSGGSASGISPEIEWALPERLPAVGRHHATRRPGPWGLGFTEAYRNDVAHLSTAFVRKNSADPAHELEAMADHLEARYGELGLRTVRRRFTWRGIPQSNLIAILPGRLPRARNRPVLIADHYDTAFSEDIFAERGERVSAPGADDNVTATAALLRAAEELKGLPLRHDVWLVHLTGEEFPGDDLGAREFVAHELLRAGRRIQGLLLLDMIGWRHRRDPIFQINPGPGEGSAFLAAVARAAALREPSVRRLDLVPVVRPAHDPKSYLYNTDGVIFATAGYPVILFNEHINKLENFERPHYHQSTDLPATLDFAYAEAIVKTAIETAARLATARGI